MNNSIGLNQDKAKELTNQLNDLLANYQLFYMNVRGFHWNIKGKQFFELHLKFEELYDDLVVKVDEIAERILTLGATPVHSFTQYLTITEIKEATNVSKGEEAVENLLDSFKILLIKQRAILNLAADTSDEGTAALMSDYIREQEKLVWMYGAFMQ